MRNRLTFQPRYFLYWLLLFALARAAFLIYHHAHTAALSSGEIVRSFLYGVRLDGSAVAYISFIPFGLLLVGSLWPRLPVGRLIGGYTAVTGIVVGLLTSADLELYRAWGFRLDATPLQYLDSPGEMAASAGSAPLAFLVAVFAGLMLLGWWLYRRLLTPLPPLPPAFPRPQAALASLLYAGLLVVPLRGGVQQIPVNQSDVYFSAAHPFANHAAINVPWNVAQSLQLREMRRNPYQYMADSAARREVAALYKESPSADSVQLLTTPRPNVLFIILESFTAKLVGHLGGERGVTPTLDSLARTGISFRNFYASGDRSQKGLVSLLSAYPNQPTTSIIKFPRKTEQLPSLARTLGHAGYHTSFYYGGELAFANMKSYLLSSGYEHLTERQDFAQRDQNSKWGAHDHVLFQRMLRELGKQPTPFFTTAFTLSSHEPFDVPGQKQFRNQDEEAFFRHSVAYTDHALGQFLQAARREAWWPNTLVVLVADHGHQLPGWMPVYDPRKFRIPLLLAGGALKPEAAGRSVATFGSQTDVAATLLAQLRLPSSVYSWSRNLLSPAPAAAPGGFAFFCFTDGYGMMTPQGPTVMDNVSRAPLTPAPLIPRQVRQGQAYQQLSFADFLEK
ncbi:LTA synthase family protein [Hymenobacter busanensis]|uniref:LTA synthase family protein n=1 Tax=Hymenobacter busanensis TaxID=2607656 RepID=A0A7L4ZTK0_9BACT|nr:LTA synthase family protein [Hymenobacter busanensis]KAA9325897.1 LTA synthase family protein [Hymenobacter busanensis]QHJ06263.1 sulfatase-like hydrolase/transferase [Hymenobacter busanensis]